MPVPGDPSGFELKNFGPLFLTSTKKKFLDEYLQVVNSRKHEKYTTFMLKNKLRIMDDYLSQLKPIVCLNSIKSIYKKEGEGMQAGEQENKNGERITGMLTRKKILMRYLNALWNSKLKELFGAPGLEEGVVDPTVKQEVLSVLAEHILSGQIEACEEDTEERLA